MLSMWGRMASCGGLLTRPNWVEKQHPLPYGRGSVPALPNRDRKGAGALNKRSQQCTP
jgi:hypothetical protein